MYAAEHFELFYNPGARSWKDAHLAAGDGFEDAFIAALVLWRALLPDADRAALPSAPIDIGVRSLRSHSAVGAAADSDRRAGVLRSAGPEKSSDRRIAEEVSP